MEVNHPWSAYSPPPPVTPLSDLNEFGCANSPVLEGWAISFGCDIALGVVLDSEEEDVPPTGDKDPYTQWAHGEYIVGTDNT